MLNFIKKNLPRESNQLSRLNMSNLDGPGVCILAKSLYWALFSFLLCISQVTLNIYKFNFFY